MYILSPVSSLKILVHNMSGATPVYEDSTHWGRLSKFRLVMHCYAFRNFRNIVEHTTTAAGSIVPWIAFGTMEALFKRNPHALSLTRHQQSLLELWSRNSSPLLPFDP